MPDASATTATVDNLVTVPAPLTPRIRAIINQVWALADAQSRAKLGKSLTERVLREFVERERIKTHSFPIPEIFATYHNDAHAKRAAALYLRKPHLDFDRFWHWRFRLLDPANPLVWEWRPVDGALRIVWQFKTDPRTLSDDVWRGEAGDEFLALYDRPDSRKTYWRNLAAVIDATVNPRAALWQLIGGSDDCPPSDAALAA
jgi:hypothetical protein